jgi:hypothetical protein
MTSINFFSIKRIVARVLAPWREIKRLQKSNDRLYNALSNPLLTGIQINNGSLDIGFAKDEAGPKMLAGMFYGMFLEHPKAVNYLETTLSCPEGSILVTVQRWDGKTPHQLRLEAEQELRSLKSQIAMQAERLRERRKELSYDPRTDTDSLTDQWQNKSS